VNLNTFMSVVLCAVSVQSVLPNAVQTDGSAGWAGLWRRAAGEHVTPAEQQPPSLDKSALFPTAVRQAGMRGWKEDEDGRN